VRTHPVYVYDTAIIDLIKATHALLNVAVKLLVLILRIFTRICIAIE